MQAVTACAPRDRSSVLWLSIYKLVLRHLLPMVREPDPVRTSLGANASQAAIAQTGIRFGPRKPLIVHHSDLLLEWVGLGQY